MMYAFGRGENRAIRSVVVRQLADDKIWTTRTAWSAPSAARRMVAQPGTGDRHAWPSGTNRARAEAVGRDPAHLRRRRWPGSFSACRAWPRVGHGESARRVTPTAVLVRAMIFLSTEEL